MMEDDEAEHIAGDATYSDKHKMEIYLIKWEVNEQGLQQQGIIIWEIQELFLNLTILAIYILNFQ